MRPVSCDKPGWLLPAWLLVLAFAAAAMGQNGEDANIAEQSTAIVAPLAPASLLHDVALAGDRLIAVGERGHILISDDLGSSWEQVAGVPTRAMLVAVEAREDRAWAVGHDSTILLSEDRGESWNKVNEVVGGDPLLDVSFTGDGSGIAVGAYSLYMTSDDWGATWETQALVDLLETRRTEPVAVQYDEQGLIDQEAMADYEPVGIDYHLNGLLRIDENLLLIPAEAGRYYVSHDGGGDWLERRLDYDGSMFGAVRVAAGMDGTGCVLMYGLRGHVFHNCAVNRAEESGTRQAAGLEPDDWESVDTGTAAGLFAGAADPDGRVWLVGASGAILSIGSDISLSDYSVDLGDDFTEIMALDDGLLLLGETGVQKIPYAQLSRH